MADAQKAIFRIRIAARIEDIFRELTRFDDPVCKIVYDLVPVGSEVEVTLTVLDMPAGTRTAKNMGFGGNFILRNLKAIAETGRPTFGARVMYAAMGAMEFMLPARSRSERWPMEKKR